MAKLTRRVTIRNGSARAILNPQRGRFAVMFDGAAGGGLRELTAGATFGGQNPRTITLADCKLMAYSRVAGELKGVYRCGGYEFDLTIKPAPRPSAFEILFGYTNSSGPDVPVSALLPLCSDARTICDFGVAQSRLRVYRHGWYAGDVSRTVGLFEPHAENSEDDAFWGDESVEVEGLVRSAGMTQVKGKGFYFTAGFLSELRQYGILSVAAREGRQGGAVSAAGIADGKPIASKRRYYSEPLYVSLTEGYAQGFADYASLAAERTEARRFPEQPTGWCSWYRYFGNVTEADVLENVKWLEDNRSRAPLRIVQVDDGWQADVGDWDEANAKFPRGMRALSDDIRKAGFTPGLWFAPFIVSGTSRTFREHPDWLVRDDDGAPKKVFRCWEKDLYALDLTNPYVLGHIAGITGRICYNWGYDYIKIDFLPLGAARGHRRDDTKTRAQVMRRGLEIIRGNAKPDTYILGCGAPFGSSGAIVDGNRVSMDVGPNWSGDCSVLTSSWALTRWWTHGLLWHNDPDCLMLREGNTKLTQSETTTLANMVVLSGGITMLSERMADLSEERLAMLAKVFPVSTTAAVPVDLYERARPAIYLAIGDRILLGVFNWEDEERTFKINPRKLVAPVNVDTMADFWSGEPSPVPAVSMTVTLAPHESRLFTLHALLRVSKRPG